MKSSLGGFAQIIFSRRAWSFLNTAKHTILDSQSSCWESSSEYRFFFLDDSTKELHYDGLSKELFDQAYGIMNEWTQLLFRILQAENPHFEYISSFVCLSLKSHWVESSVAAREEMRRHVARLAKACNGGEAVDEELLQKYLLELQDVQPFAKHLFDGRQSPTEREAWARAIKLNIRHAHKYARERMRIAGHVVADGFVCISKLNAINQAWGLTSSGVERMIGCGKERFKNNRKGSDRARWNDELEIMYTDPAQDEKLLNQAVKLWIDVYGVERGSSIRQPRVDSGSRRAGGTRCVKRARLQTEAAFMKQRSAEIAHAVAAIDVGDVQACQNHDYALKSTQVARESEFQVKKS